MLLFPKRRWGLGWKRGGCLVLVVCLVAGLRAPGWAQIVNVQPLVAAETPEGFSGALEGSLDWRTGNNPLILVSGNLLTRYRKDPHLVFLMGRVEHGRRNGVAILDRHFEHLRYRYGRWTWLQPEVFLQHDRDDFRRLALRALVGAGPRFVVASSERLDLALGLAYMLEYERIMNPARDAMEEEGFNHRISNYAIMSFRINELLRWGLTAYVQPRVDRLSDVRVMAETEVVVRITERFSLRNSLSIIYDREPPAELAPLDTIYRTNLQFRF